MCLCICVISFDAAVFNPCWTTVWPLFTTVQLDVINHVRGWKRESFWLGKSDIIIDTYCARYDFDCQCLRTASGFIMMARATIASWRGDTRSSCPGSWCMTAHLSPGPPALKITSRGFWSKLDFCCVASPNNGVSGVHTAKKLLCSVSDILFMQKQHPAPLVSQKATRVQDGNPFISLKLLIQTKSFWPKQWTCSIIFWNCHKDEARERGGTQMQIFLQKIRFLFYLYDRIKLWFLWETSLDLTKLWTRASINSPISRDTKTI